MFGNFTWRNIAIFAIAFLLVSYLMLLGIIITVDKISWNHENWARQRSNPVRF